MSILINVLKTVITVILAISNVALPTVMQASSQPFAPLDKDNCLLNFIAVSDTHVVAEDDKDAEYNNTVLHNILPGIEKAEVKPDALIITGDVTDHGEVKEWENCEKILSQYDLADRLLLAIGNHDTWTSEGDKSFKQLFKEYNKKITGKKINNVYYSTKINGYYFIFLGSEKDSTPAYFSNKQLNWLKQEMKKAAKTDKPIFVISHWPFNETHALPENFGEENYNSMTGGMGEQSAKVKKILNKYENVFLISGHIHNGLSNAAMAERNGYQSIETYGNVVSVNLPTVVNATPTRGHFMMGTGYSVEVYEKQVVFRARNYAAECWLPGYNYTFDIK